MENYISVGCDLHDESMVVMMAHNLEEPQKKTYGGDEQGVRGMVKDLRQMAKQAGGAEIVLVYEASAMGCGLHDTLSDAGIRCHIIPPTALPLTPRHQKNKADDKDALRLLTMLRAHLFAGADLPCVWIPDKQLRDDRELVRTRMEMSKQTTRLKAQIKMLLKRQSIRKPRELANQHKHDWSADYRAWLRGLTAGRSGAASGFRLTLKSYLRRLEFLEGETARLDQALVELSRTERHAAQVKALDKLRGVGIFLAMVFLTEVGDPRRFNNRRQIAAYFGLSPARYESGQQNDRKGRITRQGSGRMRGALCQGAWAVNRGASAEGDFYRRIVAKNPKAKKKATVAGMRRLLIRMWHGSLAVLAAERPAENKQDGYRQTG